jgi:hypothetical protein
MKPARNRLRRRFSRALVRRSARKAWRASVGLARRSRRAALVVAGIAALSVVLGVGVFAANRFYGEYGAPRTEVSVASWAGRSPSYLASDCRGCHSNIATTVVAAPHERLICETCHVPAVDHPGPVAGVVVMLPPTDSEACTACHSRTGARPAEFAQVEPTRHYVGADCLSCHEPHTSIAVEPREVTHPLDPLPSCITCHAPDGLKQYPANHDAAPDSVCLACHRIGAGGQ